MTKKWFTLCEIAIVGSVVAALASLPFFWKKSTDQMWTVTLQDSQKQTLGVLHVKGKDLKVMEVGHGVQINVDGGTIVWQGDFEKTKEK